MRNPGAEVASRQAGLIRNSARFLVAAELSRRGYVANFPNRNRLSNVNLLAYHPRTKVMMFFNVHGTRKAEWHFNAPSEQDNAVHPVFWVYVILGVDHSRDRFFVIPQEELPRLFNGGGERQTDMFDGAYQVNLDQVKPYEDRWGVLLRTEPKRLS